MPAQEYLYIYRIDEYLKVIAIAMDQDIRCAWVACYATAMATYKAKLFCFNCGMKGFYLLPFGLEFWPYIPRSDSLTGERWGVGSRKYFLRVADKQ